MQKLRLDLLVAALLPAFVVARTAVQLYKSSKPVEESYCASDLLFGETREQSLDLYLPKTGSRWPLIVRLLS